MFKFELGETAKDEITGFKGIITGRCDYITGCDQYMLQPKSIKSSEVPEPKWLDDNRLVIIKTTKKIKGER